MPGERVGRAPELLLDEHPLELRPALASVLAGVQPAVQLRGHRLGLDAGDGPRRAASAARSACSSSGIRTSSTKRRARAWSSACSGVSSVRSSVVTPGPWRGHRLGLGLVTASLARGDRPPQLLPPLVVQDPLRRVVPAGRHDPAARVRPRAAQVQAVHRRRVLRQRRRRPHERHLVEALLALEDVAAEQPEDPLQVRRGEHLVVDRPRPSRSAPPRRACRGTAAP